MSIKISGVIHLEGVASDGAETLVSIDLAEFAPTHSLTVNDFTTVPPSYFMDTLAAKLRDGVNRTDSMLVAGLAP